MNILNKRFEAIKESNPNFSSYSVFANAILSVTVAPQTIVKSFHELVEKKDYLPSEKNAVLAHLIRLSA